MNVYVDNATSTEDKAHLSGQSIAMVLAVRPTLHRHTLGHSALGKRLPVLPAWAKLCIDNRTFQRIRGLVDLIHNHQLSETRFLHPVVFGYTQKAVKQKSKATQSDDPLIFTPAVTELVVVKGSVLCTASDRSTGLTVETTLMTPEWLIQQINKHSPGTLLYVGDDPKELRNLHRKRTPCPHC
jgi:hypothetical protein